MRAWAAASADRREVRLPGPATAEEIALAEAKLGFALHPLLKQLYLDVANGDFGPDGWRLMPVECLTMYPRLEVPPGQPRSWPDQVLAVMDVGCAMLSAVDCSDPCGQVLLMDPNAWVDATARLAGST